MIWDRAVGIIAYELWSKTGEARTYALYACVVDCLPAPVAVLLPRSDSERLSLMSGLGPEVELVLGKYRTVFIRLS